MEHSAINHDQSEWPSLTEEEKKQIEERSKRLDRVSHEIGQRLLRGWTLLDIPCPNPECEAPLMRDKQKRMYCVQCDMPVITEAEFDPQKHRLANDQGSGQSPQAETSVAQPTIEDSDRNRTGAPPSIYEPQPVIAQTIEQLQPRNVRDTIMIAIQTLDRKLQDSCRRLEIEENFDVCTSIAKFMETAGHALRSLQDAHAHMTQLQH